MQPDQPNYRRTRPFRERLLGKIRLDASGCWLWQGATQRGYGTIGRGRRGEGLVRAHRAIYEMFVGPVPEGQFVCHTCDTPRCCNPEHLFAALPVENTHDALSKGRLTHGEDVVGVKLNESQVREIRIRGARGERAASIAVDYGVSRRNVGMILARRTWRHVTPGEVGP